MSAKRRTFWNDRHPHLHPRCAGRAARADSGVRKVMTLPKYNIGDEMWMLRTDTKEAYVECPDCCGEGRLRVIMGDETVVSIQCENCKRGYERSSGKLVVWESKAAPIKVNIKGVELTDEGVRYTTTQSYWVEEGNLFDTEEKAFAASAAKAIENDEAEKKRKLQKHNHNRSWAWNASYHRKELKEAKRKTEYHTAQLAIASVKAKQDKAAAS